MSRDRLSAVLRRWRWEIGWGVFAVGNLFWMATTQDWISIPFHFIWVSFTLLYGFRAWQNSLTWALAALVVVSTGVLLIDAWSDGTMSADEVFEVPLMFCMFLAMMLHTVRRKAAMAEVQRVSEDHARMLKRERSFVQNASHELRTPITVALAHAELVQLRVGGDDVVEEDVGIVIDELGRLRRLTDRLLTLAAVEAPKLVQHTPTDLRELVTATVRRWSPTARVWRIGRQDKATVIADPERLVVALDTLLENAMKVTTDGDPIELSVTRDGGSAVVEVSDTGPGIAAEMVGSMFDRFTTVGRQPGSPGGFGLGLAIVDAIARAHGGSVTARNRPEGGAVFALRLPLARTRERGHRLRSEPVAVPGATTDAAVDAQGSPA